MGSWQIIRGIYKPNTFSRVIWFLFALNSFVAVVKSEGSSASALLAAIFAIGSGLICLLSFWKGTRSMGNLEWICLSLLFMSAGLWLIVDAPLINLSIGLLAHFIGAIPTLHRAWHDGSTESTAFWSLFCTASVLSIILSLGDPIQKIIFPIYFTFIDGVMTILSLRNKRTRC